MRLRLVHIALFFSFPPHLFFFLCISLIYRPSWLESVGAEIKRGTIFGLFPLEEREREREREK